MKIRDIELTNIRRFAGRTVRIGEIGDGITVLSEPNEFGKSTIFDALHALFFERHRSTKATVKSLQPHSGGAPEVALTIELPEGLFRLRKRWLTRATAQVHDGAGRLIAQDDEAEAWIDRLIGQGSTGPAGLLWVRQGLVSLEPEGNSTADKTEREQNLATRRDLLSSVAGEIEMMTGGRRMDAVIARVSDVLDRLATTQLRPKAGGDWARAVEVTNQLDARRVELEALARRLSGSLARRAEVARQLKQAMDPDAERHRKEAMAAAEAALEAARTQVEKVERARREAHLADLTLARTDAELRRLQGLSTRLAMAEASLAEDRKRETAAAEGAAARRMDQETASQALRSAQNITTALRQRMLAGQRHRMAAAARSRFGELSRQVEQAEALSSQAEAARVARGQIKLTSKMVQELEQTQQQLERLQARIELQSLALTFDYQGEARALREGAVVPPGVYRLQGAAIFDLPGLGQLRIDPGQATGDPKAELDQASAVLASRLAACGTADLAAAKAKLEDARRLDEVIRRFEAVLAQLAPDGLPHLRLAMATAEAEAQGAEDAPEDLDRLSDELSAAERAEAEAVGAASHAQMRAATAAEALASATASRVAAERQFEAAKAEVPDLSALTEQIQALATDRLGQAGLVDTALTRLREFEAEILDLATLEASLSRARSAVDRAVKERGNLEVELAELNGTIGALADDGIEEQLDEVSGQLAVARERQGRIEAEVRALARLKAALDTARKEARDAYFQPVLRELGPLLSILHPGAELQIDDSTLLPVALTRDGQAEPLDILSGGTREQVAILTRLAFARLFAQSGRTVPVILDDALVHSDDDRIEAMFTALHRAAKDQQIIVLTCRQRAFANLGGTRLHAEVKAV